MKKIDPATGGLLFKVRAYHLVMMVVLRVRKQTQKEAAKELGTSISTFRKMLLLDGLPDLERKGGPELKRRIEKWSTMSYEDLFPEAFMNRKQLQRFRKNEIDRTFRYLMAIKRGQVTLELPAFTE